MKQITFFIVVLFSIQLSAQTNQQRINEGLELLKQGNYEEAYWKIRISKGRSEKKNVVSYATMAWFLNEARLQNWYSPGYDNETWIRELFFNVETAIKFDKNNVMGHLMRHVFFYEKKDYVTAGTELDIVEKLEPAHPYLGLYRGNMLFVNSQYALAAEKYSAFEARNPNYAITYWNLAQVYLHLKKYDDAVVNGKKYVSMTKGMTDSLISLYNKVAAASTRLNYLDSAYLIVKGATMPYLPRDADLYFKKYRYLVQTYYNLCSSTSLELINACIENKDDIAIAALKKGADPNALYSQATVNRFKTYPLLHAAKTHSFALMKALLEAGANPNSADDIGNTALHYLGNYTEKPEEIVPLANLLLKYKVDIEAKDNGGNSVLANALSYGYREYVEWLVYHHADVNTRNNINYTPMMTLSKNGSAILKLFIDHGAHVNDSGSGGNNVFDDIVFNENYSALYLLEKAGVRHTKSFNNANATELKAFIAYLHSDVIGKPAAHLFDALIAGDLTTFRAQLGTLNNKQLFTYLGVATIEFKYGKPFYDALVAAGADAGAQKYSGYADRMITAKETFYPTKKAKVLYDDIDMYYGSRLDELNADLEYYGNRLTSKTFVRYEACSYVIQYVKVLIKAIDFCKEAKAGILLSAESKAFISKFENEHRAALSRWEERYKTEFECKGEFPKAN